MKGTTEKNDVGNGSTIDNIVEVEEGMVYNFKRMINKTH